MKKFLSKIALLVLVVLLPAVASAEDPSDDKLIGTVRIKSNLKLDVQARKEISAAAARIKKGKSGTVKLRGSFAAATTEDEYLSKSVFMAREVEQYMRTLLPARQKIYTMFSPVTNERKRDNVVEIFLYPHELKAADFEGFRLTTVEGKPSVQQISGSQAEPPAAAGQAPERPAAAGKSASRETVRPEPPPEDVNRAEELVRRAKERAANRAKRRDDAE